ncbi:MAG TPA: glutamine amidotransferase [Candidatus Limnocylindria bacterium]|nr:glutamine amidotransferase [Candidatus Limnocylindria bacterium]
MDLRIAHLYPDLMSIYGDRGNVLALTQRARWRGIDVEVRAYTAGMTFDGEWPDLLFFGGGQDQGQDIVGADLRSANGEAVRRAIANGAAALTICGGYQLFGVEYLPENAFAIPGLGLLDVRTRAGKRRFVGNLVVETPDGILVGFENHSGRTYLGSKAVPLGAVLVGHGNNGEDRTEGAVQGRIIGTYSHGSCLPKNPWLADKLLAWALQRRHGSVSLRPLDDREERAASDQAVSVAHARP